MTAIPTNYSSVYLTTDGFDDLLLTGQTVDADGFSYTIELYDDASWGKPEAVDTAVQRWMVDGAVASTQGHDNRTLSFRVLVKADTSADLAVGEAALALRANKPGVLTYTPREGSVAAAASCFEVWTWHLEHTYDDAGEAFLQRTYQVEMTAKPWARSADRISVPAVVPPGSITVTTIDDCTTTTAWTADSSFGTLTPTVSSGAVVASHVAPDSSKSATYVIDVTHTGTVSMTTTPYIRIDMKETPPTGFLLVAADGVFLSKVASAGTVSWWAMPSGVTSFTLLTIGANFNVEPHKTPTLKLTVSDVSKTDGINPLGTTKQLVRSIAVGGSVKTSGSLHIASPSATALGTVLAYTCPDNGSGYTPAMRAYRTSGTYTVTTDLTNTVSGSWERIDGGLLLYTVPPNIFREADYTIIVRARCASAASQPVNFDAQVGGRPQAGIQATISMPFNVANTWEWHIIGSVRLPPTPTPAESAQPVVISLDTYTPGTLTNGASAQVDLDEMYLCDVTNGDLTIITPSVAGTTQVFLDSADYDLGRNRPAIYYGTQADRSDVIGVAYYEITTLDEHHFDPQGSTLFTVTDGANGSLASATFYLRGHTHMGS